LREEKIMDSKTIDNNFMYHPPREGQPEIYEEIRIKAKLLVLLIQSVVPESREKSLAITKIEESVFWANAGIARN
jgi:hypothetical protein